MGRDTLTPDEKWFKKLEDQGILRDELASIGWAFWPRDEFGRTIGYFDETSLRKLADEIERRNKPFWDEYNEWCLENQDVDDFAVDLTGEEEEKRD